PAPIDERLEGARFGERGELVFLKASATAQVVEIVEGSFGAERFEAERRLLRKTLHKTKSQAESGMRRRWLVVGGRSVGPRPHQRFQGRIPTASGHVDVADRDA